MALLSQPVTVTVEPGATVSASSPSTYTAAPPSLSAFSSVSAIFSNDPTTIGRVRSVCGLTGVSAITGVFGPITEPPADSE